MTSFQITIAPNRRAAARFINSARRKLLLALGEEQKSGLSQADIARALGIHRSVINRELRGQKDLTLGRVAELAWAMGREATISIEKVALPKDSNQPLAGGFTIVGSGNTVSHAVTPSTTGSFQTTTRSAA